MMALTLAEDNGSEGKYSEVFDATRSNTLKEDEIVRYKESLDYLNDVQRGIRHAEKQYYKKGREEGRLEVVKNLLAMGMDIDFIAQVTGLSRSNLEKLLQDTHDANDIPR